MNACYLLYAASAACKQKHNGQLKTLISLCSVLNKTAMLLVFKHSSYFNGIGRGCSLLSCLVKSILQLVHLLQQYKTTTRLVHKPPYKRNYVA